MTSHFSC